MKKKKKDYPNMICKGINNTISILKSNRFRIDRIDVLKNGRAIRNTTINELLIEGKTIFMEKSAFYEKHPDGRTQGIVIEFSGDVTKSNFPDYKNSKDVCLLALDNVEDPQNFGQIIRTSECAGIDGIIFPKHHSAPVTETVLQVSQGAFVNIPLYEVTNLSQSINSLKKNDFWVIGIENSVDAKNWYEMQYSGKILIVVGSEGRGMRKKISNACDFISTIPMQGETNSLNVSAAVSAILFERLRQIKGS